MIAAQIIKETDLATIYEKLGNVPVKLEFYIGDPDKDIYLEIVSTEVRIRKLFNHEIGESK